MLKNKIDIAIINVCTNVISEPLITFSEADLQLLLVEELRKIPIIKKLHETSVKRGKKSKKPYKTSLLHREYGGGNNTRIDIAIFDPDDVESIKYPNLVIKKVLRSAISDLICKGVKPKYYFISASGNKKSFTKKNLKLISKSLKEEQKKYDLRLSGGDTINSNKVSFSITTIGFDNRIVERNKARINDDVYVTGNIGDSYLGLKIIQKK